jgi:MoaA/NifB/PqqE/SkfB family radical SAM enzyme
MRWDLFRRLIDELRSTVVAVDFSNWGESLLHPRIFDMIRLAHQAGLYTYLSTNLHTVSDRHVEPLMTCGLDELAMSLHGLSDRTYSAYQPGFEFQAACEVIAKLTAARAALGGGVRPIMKINFVVLAVNQHEAADLPAFAARYGVGCVLSEPSLNLRYAVSPEMARRRPREARAIIAAAIDRWLARDSAHERPLYRKLLDDPALMYRGRKLSACDWPWMRLVVNYDGALSVCCGSYRAAEDLGHYQGQPLRQLWNSRPYRRCRESFRHGQRPGRPEPPVLCEECPGVLP